MAVASARPDLVVSIDFGTTCTGVAYCNVATGSDNVRHIQRWPGRTQANENKVPTLLVYPEDSLTPSSWGFLAETAQEQSGAGGQSREWFKVMLDEELLEAMRSSSSDSSTVPRLHEVEKWYTDYFQFLYRTIELRLTSELASSWEDAAIEFIFSVPTTWKPNPTVERFRKIVQRAGFGSHPRHAAVIGLTEAEAAAVHTAKNTPAIFQNGQILFVCDIGGGTTDLSVLRVNGTSTPTSSLSLEQIDVVFGSNVGSVQLDNLFQEAVHGCLKDANNIMPMGLEDLGQTAWEMRISKEYQNAKCDYGTEESLYDTPMFSIRVPGLDRRYVLQRYGIDGGDLHFQRNKLARFFDIQINKLSDMIDKQLIRLQQKLPSEQVAHMVLSGGLGNSAYVFDQLRKRYASGNSTHSNARNLRLRVAPDPQLVVCKGNVADRVQKLNSGVSVLGWRCCRSSYGMRCKFKYDPQNPNHVGLRTSRDPLDGQLYIMDHIDWFIEQGQPVSSDFPIVRPFTKKVCPANGSGSDPHRIFPSEVVASDVDRSMLPYVMNSSCRSVCKVESDFSTLPLSLFKLKNRHWWNTGKKYHRISYNVKVILGPADISFELWHEGTKLSKDTAIKVEWSATTPPAPSSSTNGATELPTADLNGGFMNGNGFR